MSLTVNALRKLQETGAFPTPEKGEGDPSKPAPADAKSEQDKAESQPEGQTAEQTPSAPTETRQEIQPPVSTEPELERPETPIVDDVKVPTNELTSAPTPTPPKSESKEASPKSPTERLESPTRSRPGHPAPPEASSADPNMTMPIPRGGFSPEEKEEQQPEPMDDAKSEASPIDPTMTMPIPPREPEVARDEPRLEPPEEQDLGMTMPILSPDDLPTAEEFEAAAAPPPSEPPRDSSMTQPFTPEQEQSTQQPAIKNEPLQSPTGVDDSVSPGLQSDIESLQAMVSEAVDGSPTPTGGQELRPDAGHADASSTGNTERLEGPGAGEMIPEPVTTETYRLFYDPVIPIVDLDASATPDPTQTMDLGGNTPIAPAPMSPSERSGTEPIRSGTEPLRSGTEPLSPKTPSEPAQPMSPANIGTDAPVEDQQQSVVIPTAYERELIEQMADKEFEKHFQNLHNQLGARSNHQMVGSYLFVSPMQTPRTADVTANLALLLEQYERDVLLIDANLEKQTLTRRLEALNQAGFCDVVASGTQPADVVLPTSLKRLRFVPSGDDVTGISRVPNQVDMHRMRQLLTAWCDDRRTIICDAGSIDSSIALPMAQAFDGIILVVSMVDLNVDAVHAASRILTEYQVRNVLGCVVTDS